MRKYFIYNGETEVGPFDFEQLKSLQIKSDTPIWYEGLENWTTVDKIDELKTIIVSTPPKFENTKQNFSNPPKFSNYEKPTKKNNVLRNVLIGLGILLISVLVISAINSEPSEAELELMDIKADSIIQKSERERINSEKTIKNRNYRNNWQDFLTVTTNKYSYYEIGGIENLQIIVTNKTEYKIDEFKVNVCYVIDNGDCYKNEQITIYNIPAKSQKSEPAPNSNRGKRVDLFVEEIYSDELNFGYAPGNWSKNSDDPFFTKEKR
ncbi:DUF4339 domain-containing protein [Flavobacterium haoranii]|uniref:GYF domain-containing protein n=1 Tax=Flavobacterium haoranii TaxID=683124 RepID=A0A1M6H4E6_9FLAO|nr:DUF4339 domain-containing protein [Flavobacterium haoranii]SHJ17048.1 protein of unknown function [Flavobacterium haoranii]